jgi:hypothetical protein
LEALIRGGLEQAELPVDAEAGNDQEHHHQDQHPEYDVQSFWLLHPLQAASYLLKAEAILRRHGAHRAKGPLRAFDLLGRLWIVAVSTVRSKYSV